MKLSREVITVAALATTSLSPARATDKTRAKFTPDRSIRLGDIFAD